MILTNSKIVIQKITESTSAFIGNEIAISIAKVSRFSPQNNLKTIANKHDKEIPKERYISSEGRQKTIDDLRLI